MFLSNKCRVECHQHKYGVTYHLDFVKYWSSVQGEKQAENRNLRDAAGEWKVNIASLAKRDYDMIGTSFGQARYTKVMEYECMVDDSSAGNPKQCKS